MKLQRKFFQEKKIIEKNNNRNQRLKIDWGKGSREILHARKWRFNAVSSCGRLVQSEKLESEKRGRRESCSFYRMRLVLGEITNL